jgi:hypothetical protein
MDAAVISGYAVFDPIVAVWAFVQASRQAGGRELGTAAAGSESLQQPQPYFSPSVGHNLLTDYRRAMITLSVCSRSVWNEQVAMRLNNNFTP